MLLILQKAQTSFTNGPNKEACGHFDDIHFGGHPSNLGGEEQVNVNILLW